MLIYFNAKSSGSSTTSEGRGLFQLEEVCLWGWASRFQQPSRLSVSLFLLPVDPGEELCASLQHHICFRATMLPNLEMD